jgi:hypothetical protein
MGITRLFIFLEVAKKLGLYLCVRTIFHPRNGNFVSLIIEDRLVRDFFSLNALIKTNCLQGREFFNIFIINGKLTAFSNVKKISLRSFNGIIQILVKNFNDFSGSKRRKVCLITSV